jgi:hypothetical protein
VCSSVDENREQVCRYAWLYRVPRHRNRITFAILKASFADRYIYAGLGTTVLLGPKVTVKAEAGQPNKEAMDAEDLRTYRQAMTQGPLRGLGGQGSWRSGVLAVRGLGGQVLAVRGLGGQGSWRSGVLAVRGLGGQGSWRSQASGRITQSADVRGSPELKLTCGPTQTVAAKTAGLAQM